MFEHAVINMIIMLLNSGLMDCKHFFCSILFTLEPLDLG